MFSVNSNKVLSENSLPSLNVVRRSFSVLYMDGTVWKITEHSDVLLPQVKLLFLLLTVLAFSI
jgi:hypothetical protein